MDHIRTAPADGPGHGTHQHGTHQHGTHEAPDMDPARLLSQEFWDERYGGEPVWSGNPNPLLVRYAADLPPGSALDVGSGEGADVLWLASRGWTVTGAGGSARTDRADRAAVGAGHQRRVLGQRPARVVRRRALPLGAPPLQLRVVHSQLEPPLRHD